MLFRYRVIPVLLLRDKGLYKSVKFKNHKYVGDPINVIRIFNEKEVDEIILLDINATINNHEPDYKIIEDIASECFMPLCYGGGINNLKQIERILKLGVEKIVINSRLFDNLDFVRSAVDNFGSSTIVASIDYKYNFLGGNYVYTHSGTYSSNIDVDECTRIVEEMGVGEIILNSIDKDGTLSGYDHKLINKITHSLSIPLIACGGASSLSDFHDVIHIAGASAVAAGSFFVFVGPHRAVLVNYPTQLELEESVFKNNNP